MPEVNCNASALITLFRFVLRDNLLRPDQGLGSAIYAISGVVSVSAAHIPGRLESDEVELLSCRVKPVVRSCIGIALLVL